jgi:hypothetical protein
MNNEKNAGGKRTEGHGLRYSRAWLSLPNSERECRLCVAVDLYAPYGGELWENAASPAFRHAG